MGIETVEGSAGTLIAGVLKPLTDSDLKLVRGRVKHWLRETIILMVDHREDVAVSEGSMKETETQLKVLCHRDDVGKVIGKMGRTARSLRILLLTVSRATGHTFNLDIVDASDAKRADRLSRVLEANQ